MEEFVTAHKPEALIHRWRNYVGTGRDVFGNPTIFSHGRPGVIFDLNVNILKIWIEHNPPEEVWKLYNMFIFNDQEAIEKKINNIWEGLGITSFR